MTGTTPQGTARGQRGAGRDLPPVGRPAPVPLRRGETARRRIGALAALACLLPQTAAAAEPLLGPDPTLTVSALGVAALAIGIGILGLAARRRLAEDNAALERENRELRTRWTRAERLLNAQPGTLYVWPDTGPEPEVRGAAPTTLAAVRAGPDADQLAPLLEALRRSGTAFGLDLAAGDGQRYRAEGRTAGAAAALWLSPLPAAPAIPAPAPPVDPGERGLLEALPVPVWRRDADLRLVYANQAYAEAVGAASPAAALAAQAALDRREPQLAREAQIRGQLAFEKRYVISGGRRRAFMLLARPLGAGSAGLALDVTPIEEAEQRLQTHRDAHDETLNKLKTAVAVFGADQKLAFYNRAYATLWGFDPAWLDTRPGDGEILERLRSMRRVPEQRDFRAWKRQRLHLYRQPAAAPLDEFWHLPDDTTIRVMCQPHPLGGLLFLYDDVTNELALQRKYNTLITVQKETLDTLSEGVAVFGPDGRLQLSNAAFARVWRLDPQMLAAQPHFREITALCRPLVGDSAAWERLAAHVTGYATERLAAQDRLIRSDGSVVQTAAVPLPDGATLLSFVDVTDSVRAEQRLIERNAALETADRMKTAFVAHVSYQLRTPLASILGFAEMLEQGFAGGLAPKQRDYLGHVLQGAATLRDLVDDILDLAVIDAGEAELELAEIDVAAMIDSVVPLVRARADQAGVTLYVETEGELGVLTADLRRVRQAIFNLLSNAIGFSETGGIVTLTARAGAAGVAISVADTGAGIPREYQSRVFDRFESRRRSSRGAGLGLALVKSFIELHGGLVTLDSRPGEGTVVTCHLPRRPLAPRRAAE